MILQLIEKYCPKTFFWFKEWILTFSLVKSILSSKKIERFIFIATALGLIVFYVIKNVDKMTATDLTIITGPLFIYAGFNLTTTEKSKKDDTHP